MSNTKRPASAGTSATVGSAFLLVKRCPDGRCININLQDEEELRGHLEAMWRVTPDYHVVAVIQMPNAEGHAQGKPDPKKEV